MLGEEAYHYCATKGFFAATESGIEFVKGFRLLNLPLQELLYENKSAKTDRTKLLDEVIKY